MTYLAKQLSSALIWLASLSLSCVAVFAMLAVVAHMKEMALL